MHTHMFICLLQERHEGVLHHVLFTSRVPVDHHQVSQSTEEEGDEEEEDAGPGPWRQSLHHPESLCWNQTAQSQHAAQGPAHRSSSDLQTQGGPLGPQHTTYTPLEAGCGQFEVKYLFLERDVGEGALIEPVALQQEDLHEIGDGTDILHVFLFLLRLLSHL